MSIAKKRRRLNNVAKHLRSRMTRTETMLWKHLRHMGFLAQQPLVHYIPDFYHAATGVIVEVDGGYHDNPESKRRDEHRDSVLMEHGYRVMRFTADRVLDDRDAVLQEIAREIHF